MVFPNNFDIYLYMIETFIPARFYTFKGGYLSKKFLQRWQSRSESPSQASKLLPPINYAVNRVKLQIQKLNSQINQYTERDKALFEKIVHAYESHDNSRATIFAKELAEMQRQRDLLINAKLALENILLRLQTLAEFRSPVSDMSPVVGNLQNIQTRISGVLPDFGKELGQVEMKLTNLKVNTGQGAGAAFDFGVGSQDAQKIIEEAAIIAENQTRMKFPDIPNNRSGPGGT